MKLSTAIRIGSMTTKQTEGLLTDGRNGRCAIGAALDAAGLPFYYDVAEIQWPILGRYIPSTSSLIGCIVDWNDRLHMSREWIADRVEQVEDALEHDGYIGRDLTESKPLELIAQEAK